MWILWLFLILCGTYGPFLGTRFIRTAGDEKVYVSQAVEMAQQNHWFVQTLQNQPDYYKGPFHYILLRLGMSWFPHSPWAVLYMNFALLFFGALALGLIVKKRLPEWKGGPLFTSTLFALSTGIYAHMFASQMEVELASLFAVMLWLLDKLPLDRGGYILWLVIGLTGTVKSPLHAVFGGVTALLFWLCMGELWKRLKNPKTWLAILSGVALCTLAYLPAFLLDRENFMNLYIIRETFAKSTSEQHWSVAVVSSFGFYLFPWLLVGIVAYFQTAFQIFPLFRNIQTRRLLLLSICVLFPSVGFFIWHSYHFENYNLPVFSGVVLLIATVYSQRRSFWRILYSGSFGLTALLILSVPIVLSVLAWRFSPLPAWWPQSLLEIIWAGVLVTSFGFFRWGCLKSGNKPSLIAISSVGLFVAFGALFSTLGEREMVDLRAYLVEHPKAQLAYYNVQQNIWSEWGILRFWIDRPVEGLHKKEDIKPALLAGKTLLVPARGPLEDFRKLVAEEMPGVKLEFKPWKRWRTHGESETGKPLWQEAWEKRDLSLMETDYFIVWAKGEGST